MDSEKQFSLKVEIIIVSYNRLKILAETINKLRLLYPSTLLCLGIQGEEPSTEFVNQYVLNQPTRLQLFSEPSVTRTLNSCIKTSEAEICLLLDDDAWPCHNWVEGHLDVFHKDQNLLFTTGREIRTNNCRFFGKELFRYFAETAHSFFTPSKAKLCGRIVGWATTTGFVFGNFDLPGEAVINSARGCNMGLRREAFFGVGGFNENFQGNSWGFETEFALRAQKAGMLGRYVGNAVVLHNEARLGGTRSQEGQAYMRDFAHNQRLLTKQLGPWAFFGNFIRLFRVRKAKHGLPQ